MISDNLNKIRQLIAKSAKVASTDPSGVKLLAVTKGIDLEQIRKIYDLGLRDFGENRIHESEIKIRSFQKDDISWHFIGHLQTNKAKDAVRLFRLIHSLDSLRLANSINSEASALGKVQDVLIEVNTSGEVSKYGIRPDEVRDFLLSIQGLNNISIKGLMTMAPIVDDKEMARPYFKILRDLFDELKAMKIRNADFKYLSMGMSQDFEVAIEEGANIVRIGTALFKL